ncbi:Accessory gene regulator protein A [uncultured Clostridium sp.]|nr:Accessory gene regulator protein A [uncultured Clostridium sp.]
MVKIGVCDDISLQRNFTVEMIKRYLNSRNIEFSIYEFSSGEDLIENYPDGLDILFLDILMDDITGMDASKKIREFDDNVEILFVTSTVDYVHEGYEVRAYRYIMKPISYETIEKHLKECVDNIIKRKNNHIIITTKNNLVKVDLDSILYIETCKRELIIHEKDKSHRVKMSMKNMEKILNGKNFFRCHTSFIVNLMKVDSLNKNTIYIQDKEVPISKYAIKEFKVSLANCLGAIVC